MHWIFNEIEKRHELKSNYAELFKIFILQIIQATEVKF